MSDDNRTGPVQTVLLTVIVSVLVGGVLYLTVFAFMNAGVTSKKTVVTTIEKKQFTHAIQIGKVHHPESYFLQFTIEGNRVGSTVHKEFFDSLDVGDKIEVDCEFGKLGNSFKPVRFLKLAH